MRQLTLAHHAGIASYAARRHSWAAQSRGSAQRRRRPRPSPVRTVSPSMQPVWRSKKPCSCLKLALMRQCLGAWTGLHWHALMTCIAFGYLQHLRLAEQRPARSGKNASSDSGTATIAKPAVRRAIMTRLFADLVAPIRCSHCRRKLSHQLISDCPGGVRRTNCQWLRSSQPPAPRARPNSPPTASSVHPRADREPLEGPWLRP